KNGACCPSVHCPDFAPVASQGPLGVRCGVGEMDNPFEERKSKSPRATRLLDIDAWIDSSLYDAGFKAREAWEAITIFFRRFRVTGWRRGFFELASAGFTLGTVGAILMLALALPAFEETSKDWRSQ